MRSRLLNLRIADPICFKKNNELKYITVSNIVKKFVNAVRFFRVRSIYFFSRLTSTISVLSQTSGIQYWLIIVFVSGLDIVRLQIDFCSQCDTTTTRFELDLIRSYFLPKISSGLDLPAVKYKATSHTYVELLYR